VSGDIYSGLVLPENLIRDLSFVVVNGGNVVFDMSTLGGVGLDWFLNNNGAAAITVSWNGLPAVTIAAGAALAMSSTRYWIINIVAAVNYDLVVAGVRFSTLKAKELI
jgi:hypothetical protein